MDRTAYQQGIDASRRGETRDDCQYTSGDARASWMIGWQLAETGELEFQEVA
jgi:ribosome modulation factor